MERKGTERKKQEYLITIFFTEKEWVADRTLQFSSVQFSPSVVSDCLWPHGLQHTRLPCPSPTPRAFSNSCISNWWCLMLGKIESAMQVNFICVVVVYKLNLVQLFAPPWIVAHQASLSMEFPRQECWSGLPFSPPGYLPKPGIKPTSFALAGRFFTTEPPGKPLYTY